MLEERRANMKRVLNIIKTNIVMIIALILALITMIFVPPDAEYLGYFDFKTLTCLFTTLAVVCALRNVRFFYTVAEKIIKFFKNTRLAVIALIYITFIGSMILANDMALLTFLPLGYFVLLSSGKEKYMCVTFILQNIAANLGGMLTPFGNPQNLYLYSKFNIPDGEFILIMLPLFLVSIFMITVCCIIFVKPEPIEFNGVERKLPPIKITVYFVLFALAILSVFNVVPYIVALIAVPTVILIMDRRALLNVDYGLLLTFVFFFIFSGNMARIDIVRDFLSFLLEKGTLLVSALCCQFMSNVPTAILLSQFTENYKELLMGVNIGGCGTIISSLASLITFREYSSHNPGKGEKYLLVFSLFNFAFLGILLLLSFLLLAI